MKNIGIIALGLIVLVAVFLVFFLPSGDLANVLSGIGSNIGFNTGNDVPEPLDSEPVNEENPEFDNFDIYTILCQLSDKNLDRGTTYEYIDRLNMEVYGSETDYEDIYGEYSIYYEDLGWDLEVREFLYPPSGGGAIIAYSQGTQADMVMTASTDAIQDLYGYNTLTLTLSGDLATYNAFINFIESS